MRSGVNDVISFPCCPMTYPMHDEEIRSTIKSPSRVLVSLILRSSTFLQKNSRDISAKTKKRSSRLTLNYKESVN